VKHYQTDQLKACRIRRENEHILKYIEMKIYKLEIKYLVRIFIIWTLLNLALNTFGLFLTKLLNQAEYTHFASVANEFVIPLIIQSVLFAICLTVASAFMKSKKFVPYIFVAFQFILFHIIFFINLKIHHGLHFESTFSNYGLRYLSYSGQYLIDILYLYFPINGNFDNGIFQPDNLGTFYIHWILLNIVYYFGLTWITLKAAKLNFKKKSKKLPVTTEANTIEAE